HQTSEVHAIEADDEMAQYLACEAGAPLLHVAESDTHFPKDDSRDELLTPAIVVFEGYAVCPLDGQSILGQNRCCGFIMLPTDFSSSKLSSMHDGPVPATSLFVNGQPRFNVVSPATCGRPFYSSNARQTSALR
ncbi:MAG TPA: hypothetical protein VK879_22205, partial [Candidatus Sulfomarinibacteraceae bacterium]|nr:hypothetical protein [Candidatus Sulfomarinibacteraceae bacterium]